MHNKRIPLNSSNRSNFWALAGNNLINYRKLYSSKSKKILSASFLSVILLLGFSGVAGNINAAYGQATGAETILSFNSDQTVGSTKFVGLGNTDGSPGDVQLEYR